jgi:hypothetical protein
MRVGPTLIGQAGKETPNIKKNYLEARRCYPITAGIKNTEHLWYKNADLYTSRCHVKRGS